MNQLSPYGAFIMVVARRQQCEGLLGGHTHARDLAHGHHPFGLAQRRGLDIFAHVGVWYAQLAQLGLHAAGSRYAVEQNEIGCEGHDTFIVDVGFVSHVGDGVAVGVYIGVGDEIETRHADYPVTAADGAEHRYVR